jgi:hypothetical protein
MDLYVIRRRDAWASQDELEAAGGRSTAEGDKGRSGPFGGEVIAAGR